MSAEREKLFNDIILLKHNIQHLASYVQNDFSKMLEDGIIDKKEIASLMVRAKNDFNATMLKLDQYGNDTMKMMKQYSREN